MSIYRQKAFETKRKWRILTPKFKVNDLVRIQKLKNKFSRGYERNFTTEVFIISKVLSHLPIRMYTVSDLNDNHIRGNFYVEELSPVMGNIFTVEKVLKRKTEKNKKYVFVKWEGFPNSYNSWINEKDII